MLALDIISNLDKSGYKQTNKKYKNLKKGEFVYNKKYLVCFGLNNYYYVYSFILCRRLHTCYAYTPEDFHKKLKSHRKLAEV